MNNNLRLSMICLGEACSIMLFWGEGSSKRIGWAMGSWMRICWGEGSWMKICWGEVSSGGPDPWSRPSRPHMCQQTIPRAATLTSFLQRGSLILTPRSPPLLSTSLAPYHFVWGDTFVLFLIYIMFWYMILPVPKIE